MPADKNCERGKHGDLFPVVIDYECEFLVLECANCTARVWRNVHRLRPDEGGA